MEMYEDMIASTAEDAAAAFAKWQEEKDHKMKMSDLELRFIKLRDGLKEALDIPLPIISIPDGTFPGGYESEFGAIRLERLCAFRDKLQEILHSAQG